MILSGKDKLYHITACFLITVVVFAVLLAARRFHETQSARIEEERDIEDARRDNNTDTLNTGRCSFNRCIHKNWALAAVASWVAVLIGIVKEIGDMYNFWWLCQSKNEDGSIVGCDASWADFLADVVGIILANCIIFMSLWLWALFLGKETDLNAEYTMARTISDT